ncbi:MAG: deoxynucleoside kinase [Clostridia bacterium]|nr:deoxynucleoside kinase [Clostridia bacterium]MBR2417093.1 deoxynucleoside kinase [Clostridia bacterium]
MGKIIVIEGLDASGKDTQSRLLQERLNKEGYETYKLDLPYYDDPSSTLVKMYLGGELGDKPSDVNAYAASTFYAVDRYASFKKHWQKEYESDKIIVANRYTTSNASHQMTKLSEDEWDSYLQWLFEFEYKKMGIPEPDCVIFLDMPVEISQKLLMKRYEGDSAKKDVHERDVEYLKACHRAAEYASRKLSWNVILCGENMEPFSFEYISDKVYDCVKKEIF